MTDIQELTVLSLPLFSKSEISKKKKKLNMCGDNVCWSRGWDPNIFQAEEVSMSKLHEKNVAK